MERTDYIETREDIISNIKTHMALLIGLNENVPIWLFLTTKTPLFRLSNA